MEFLDSGQLAALFDLAGPETAAMIEDYAQSSRQALQEMEGLFLANNAEVAAELAHRIQGGAATVGFAALGQRAALVEAELRHGKLPAPTDIAALRLLLDNSVTAVQRILAAPGPQA